MKDGVCYTFVKTSLELKLSSNRGAEGDADYKEEIEMNLENCDNDALQEGLKQLAKKRSQKIFI